MNKQEIINILVHPGYISGNDNIPNKYYEKYYEQLDKGDLNIILHPQYPNFMKESLFKNEEFKSKLKDFFKLENSLSKREIKNRLKNRELVVYKDVYLEILISYQRNIFFRKFLHYKKIYGRRKSLKFKKNKNTKKGLGRFMRHCLNDNIFYDKINHFIYHNIMIFRNDMRHEKYLNIRKQLEDKYSDYPFSKNGKEYIKNIHLDGTCDHYNYHFFKNLKKTLEEDTSNINDKYIFNIFGELRNLCVHNLEQDLIKLGYIPRILNDYCSFNSLIHNKNCLAEKNLNYMYVLK